MLTMLALLTACSTEDVAVPAGSTLVVYRQSLFTANTWDGTVSRTSRDGVSEGEVELGGEPTRMVRVGDELWVTLRAERAVAVLDISGEGAPVETARFQVGAEPYGIASTSDGSRVYVAVSQQDQVVEFDGADRTELRRWDVMNEPRWLAMHPCDCALFVASGFDAPVARIELESGQVTRIEPPETELPSDEGDTIDLTPRNTGDLAVSPAGDVLVWPVLYVDNRSPGDQPIVNAADITPPSNPYYAPDGGASGLQLSISKFNPALVAVPLDIDSGEPLPGDDAIALFVGGFADGSPKRGYLTGVTFDGNGTTVYAPMEGANAVAAVDLRPAAGQGMSLAGPSAGGSTSFVDTAAPSVAPADGNFYERSQAIVSLAGNPYAVALDSVGRLYVHERGGRSVSTVGRRPVQSQLDRLNRGEFVVGSFAAEERLVAGTRRTTDEFEAGRQMFYTSEDSRMTTAGAGVSCATCHFEGRNDGLTWSFDENPRQTPSLAGNVGETTPVTWSLGVESVAREAQITTIGRMGGQGIDEHLAATVESFVNSIRAVDVEHNGRRDAQIERGQALFEDPVVGCAGCHSGARATDQKRHRVFGRTLAVDTPSLTGIDATPPYLHDGSAITLRAVLERARDGSMGDTSDLSADDMDALVAYLRTL